MTESTPRSRTMCSVIVAVGACMVGGTAMGDITYPNVTLEFYAGNDGQPSLLFDMSTHSSAMGQVDDSVYFFQGGATGSSWELGWSMTVSPKASGGQTIAGGGGGPYIHLANLAVTNTTGENQIFWVLVTLEIETPILVDTFSKGDVQANIQSYLGQGATLKNITSGDFAGDSIYEALLDGDSVHTLMDSPTEITSVGSQTASASAAFGQDLDVVTGPAMETMSIWLKIEVTAHSIATVIGQYEVIPVPGPAALPLLALGALAVGRRRRR